MSRLSALLAVLFLLPVAALAQEEQNDVDWTFKNKKLRDSIAAYEKAVKKLDDAFQERQSTLKEAYDEKRKKYRLELMVQFEEALQEASKAVDLKEANKINAAIKALHGGAETPGVVGRAGSDKARIPRDAVKWNGHHYKLFTTPMTWHLARDFCESIGGHLARIQSSEEQQFIERLVRGVRSTDGWIYVDGSDEKTEGQWIFSNDTKIKYTNWLKGVPNNKGHGEHSLCVMVQTGRWEDAPSTVRNLFVCEWDQ